MIHAGGGRLNPAQPASLHHFIPRDGVRLGMAAVDVGFEYLLGDSLLARIDQFGVGNHGGNLVEVLLFRRVAQYNSHSARSMTT